MAIAFFATTAVSGRTKEASTCDLTVNCLLFNLFWHSGPETEKVFADDKSCL